MATKVVMAQLSPTMEEGRLVEWKISEGDEVEQGDIVAEIETDKANMDVEALGGGVLRKIVVQEGETVPVGALIGVIAAPEEEIDAILEEAEAGAAEEAAAPEAEAEPPEEEEAEPAEAEEAAAEEPEAGRGRPRAEAAAADRREDGRVRASPLARKMAAGEGLELSRISGSGPAGRITKRDVEEALSERGRPGAGRPAAPARLAEQTVEASQMRKAIARRLAESLGPVPHFFLTSEIAMDRALELRAEMNDRLAAESGDGTEQGADGGAEEGGGGAPAPARKIGVNDLLLKSVAEALVRHPEINASWGDGEIRRHGSVDLGIAVAVDEGLITPVLREADRKGLRQIATEAGELIRRARSRDLDPEEYQGATFSVSNLGMFPIEQFTAIINPPEAAILAVGRTVEKPVVENGEVRVRRRMRVTMSCDHRVIDGAMGARFLETYKEMMENPLEMLL